MSPFRGIAGASALAASLMVPTVASAACKQADLTGLWQAYVSSFASGEDVWARCVLKINAAGRINDTACVYTSGAEADFTDGKATISEPAACTFKGQFKINGTVNKVVHATLARDKLTADGVGTFEGGGFTFSLNKLGPN